MMEFAHLLVEKDSGVATVTINRHEKRNMLGALTLKELGEAFDALENDEEVRAVLLTGAGGKAFCAGAELDGGFDLDGDVKEFARAGQALFRRIESFPKPVVAAVEGYALGGGCELMMSCDIVVAAENSAIGLPESGLGLLPGWGGTQLAPRLAGKNVAMEMLLLGGRMRAPRAYELGIANCVAAKGEAMKTAKEIAERLSRMPEHSMRLIKKAAVAGLREGIEKGYATEAEAFAEAFEKSETAKKLRGGA